MCGYMTWIVRVQVRSFAARELSAGGEYRKTVVLYGGGRLMRRQSGRRGAQCLMRCRAVSEAAGRITFFSCTKSPPTYLRGGSAGREFLHDVFMRCVFK